MRINYVTPYWGEGRYGDYLFDIPNQKVTDRLDARTFVETFFKTYACFYATLSPSLEQNLEQLRKRYCTSAMLKKYAVMAQQSIEDEGLMDPLIACADFDAFWYPSLKVTPQGEGRYVVSYNTGAHGRDIRVFVTVAHIKGKPRICDLEIE